MLEAKNITFAYGAGRGGAATGAVLQNFSISISPGERVYLAAPSGRGKTTLCNILAGYTPARAYSGQVLVDGQPLPQRGVCPVQLIGQHPERALDPRQRMQAVLDEVGAPIDPHLVHHLGIQPQWLTRFPHELSGGEMQRFCIARALAAAPRYLIADEVSTMLDALTQARVWHVLLEECQRRNLGLLFTTHSPALAQKIATRMVEL